MRAAAFAAAVAFAVVVCANGMQAAAQDDAPVRGVPKPKLEAYHRFSQQGSFRCLDESRMIAWATVNDDYCDCADGSDEPGTSACPNAQFYCVNAGHIGAYIPSSQVQDGVCDCCDGSDERDGKCSDVCAEANAKYLEEHEASLREARAGATVLAEWVAEAKQTLEGKEEEVQAAQARLTEAEAVLEEKKAATAAAEAEQETLTQERAADADVNAAQRLGIGNFTAEELRGVLFQLVRQARLSADLINLLSTEYAEKLDFPLWKDPGPMPDGTPAPTPSPIWVDTSDSSWVSESLRKARREELDAEHDVNTRQRELDNVKDDQTTDFGPNLAFFNLKGRCVRANVQKYKYEVCPFDKAQQDVTNLGRWDGFEDNYTVMKFSNGQSCWGGPKRSMTVTLACGAEDELVNVQEPSTCTYTAMLKTPAACDLKGADAAAGSAAHDEL